MRLELVMLGLLAAASPALAAEDGAAIVARNNRVVLERYPPASLVHGEHGIVAWRARVDRDGHLMSCAVTASSGFAMLDRGTCDMLVETATFTPLYRTGGRRSAGVRVGRVEWRLPAGYAPAPAPEALPPLPAPIVCRRQLQSGSLSVAQKICMTEAQWLHQLHSIQTRVESMGMAMGPPGNAQVN